MLGEARRKPCINSLERTKEDYTKASENAIWLFQTKGRTGNGVRMRTLDESSSEFKRLWHLRQKSQPTVQETASVFLFFDCLSAKYPGENGIEPAERIGRVYDGFVSLGMLNQVV